MRYAVLFCFLSLFFASCVKDKPDPGNNTYQYLPGRKVLISNEGNYGGGNASLAIYNSEKDVLMNDAYTTVNREQLGDVLQSVCVFDNKIYMAVNNSHRVVVADAYSLSKITEIPVPFPRYFLPLNELKMYVSSLYTNKIYVVNPLTNTIDGEIALDHSSAERMIVCNGMVYACNWDTASSVIYEIDPMTDEVSRRITIPGRAPQSVLADKNGLLWVFYGNVEKAAPYGIAVVEPSSGSVVRNYVFSSETVEMIKPVFNSTRDTLFWLGVDYAGSSSGNGVYKMAIDAAAVPAGPFITASPFQYYYAIGIDTTTNRLYLGDPKSFTERSDIYIYTTGGDLLHKMTTDIGVGEFYFYD